ncbi:hypothetical protein P3719_23475 [Vibrio parahaemolyticus]|nr:hypothetical protein [Vibrio parahaemolyticus]ATI48423.1 hypothetical protein CO725_23620 [Vibrio parahaemolyticus]AWG83612.1 hypothetical protein Vp2S01_1272 [Vibrio parahaemolyticus]EGQ8503567.1 hypothetical protein [Vibrio parahaemolyticus]EGQ8681844.1 hypothetical protein [Vibrio parahaemolyticus]EGQ8699961.1 hypothetical protein [Vibrio parahaemolyticus]
MNSDVNEIIDMFIATEPKFGPLPKYFFESSLEKWSLLLSFLCLVVTFALLFFGQKEYAIYSVMLCYLFVVGYVLSTAIGALSFLFSAKRSALSAIKANSQSAFDLARDLAKFNVASLKHVKGLFEKRILFLSGRMSFLVGAMDKLGIFPALFMLYYTYTQLPKIESDTLNLVHIWAVSFLGGLYIGTLLIKSIIDTLRNHINIIDLALDEVSEYRLP